MKNTLLLFSILLLASCSQKNQQSVSGSGTVNNFTTDGKNITVYTTADSTDYRLSTTGTSQFKLLEQTRETEFYVFVNPDKTFQTLLGIGGALTDAAAETFAKLPDAKKKELLEAYYSPQKGIGYTLGRTNINSCDFSSDSYTYVNEGDKELESFNIDHDRKFKIPLIKQRN